MGLVNELQESAERDDAQTLLRKAKRVSAKLKRDDISRWLKNEQNGYPEGAEVPSYRDINVSFYYNTNGYVPAGYGYLKSGIGPLPGKWPDKTISSRRPISTIVEWVNSINKQGVQIYEELPKDIDELVRALFKSNNPEVLAQITFMVQLNESDIRDIPEQVKNRVLDWACDLESAGVTGDGHSFSNAEKETAKTVILNIINSTIDQLNSSGTNLKG
jgi:hypothetical protein